MSKHIELLFNGACVLSAASILLLAGCEQRPADVDPPPITPGERSPDSRPPARQPLNERAGQGRPSIAAPTENQSSPVIASLSNGRARAQLQPTQGNSTRGTVDFSLDASTMSIHVRLAGLDPGAHGLHIHEFGDCSTPDGSSAGEHFAPDHDPHGAPGDPPPAHHLGDLGNITADADGGAEARMQDDELQLTGDFGVVGRAVVVHVGEDDLKSQPSGNSGDPVACGVVRLVTDSADRV
jgi:Cu-Zn family superoxide dismutase